MKKRKVLGLIMAMLTFGGSLSTVMATDSILLDNVLAENMQLEESMPPNMTPLNGNMPLSGYEVKFMVDSSKLVNENGLLTNEAKEIFNITTDPNAILVTYLDTDEKVFNENGWSNRLRKKDGKKNYEIQYKKRYKVENYNLTDAFNRANLDGFTVDDIAYEAEVDWGFDKMTLSIATETKIPTTKDLQLPNEKEGAQMVYDNMPQELNEYSLEMSNIRYFGPIEFQRYTGEFNGMKLDVEVWPIKSEDGQGTEIITEVSFKSSDYDLIWMIREQLKELLANEQILLEKDSLKTDLIMQRY